MLWNLGEFLYRTNEKKCVKGNLACSLIGTFYLHIGYRKWSFEFCYLTFVLSVSVYVHFASCRSCVFEKNSKLWKCSKTCKRIYSILYVIFICHCHKKWLVRHHSVANLPCISITRTFLKHVFFTFPQLEYSMSFDISTKKIQHSQGRLIQ